MRLGASKKINNDRSSSIDRGEPITPTVKSLLDNFAHLARSVGQHWRLWSAVRS